MTRPDLGKFPITQRFDDPCCRASYQQFGLQGHNGLDIGCPAWTPIVAAQSGTITSGFEAGGYGNYVFITGSGYETVCGHLAKISRASGPVTEGELIGYSGNTGFSSGAHLHWGVRPLPYNRNNGFMGYIDPLSTMDCTEIKAIAEDRLKTIRRYESLYPAVVADRDNAYKIAEDRLALIGRLQLQIKELETSGLKEVNQKLDTILTKLEP